MKFYKKRPGYRDKASEGEILDKLARLESTVNLLYESLELSAQSQSPFDMKAKLIKARQTTGFNNVFKKSNPLVSVIVPASREPGVVNNSLKSVLSQKYENIEVILVVEKGKNEYRDVMKNLSDNRLRKIVNPDFVGPVGRYSKWATSGASSRNLGMKLAKGDFLCFLDDDDIMLENKVSKCLSVAKENRSEIVGHTQAIRRNASTDALQILQNKFLKEKKFLSGSIDSIGLNTTTIFFHKWFKQIPWPLLSYRNMTGEDKVYMRMLFAVHPKFSYIDEILVEKNSALWKIT